MSDPIDALSKEVDAFDASEEARTQARARDWSKLCTVAAAAGCRTIPELQSFMSRRQEERRQKARSRTSLDDSPISVEEAREKRRSKPGYGVLSNEETLFVRYALGRFGFERLRAELLLNCEPTREQWMVLADVPRERWPRALSSGRVEPLDSDDVEAIRRELGRVTSILDQSGFAFDLENYTRAWTQTWPLTAPPPQALPTVSTRI